MASLNITFNGTAQDLSDFCSAFNYQPLLPDGVTPNPVTQTQFFTNQIKQYATNSVVGYRKRQAVINIQVTPTVF